MLFIFFALFFGCDGQYKIMIPNIKTEAPVAPDNVSLTVNEEFIMRSIFPE